MNRESFVCSSVAFTLMLIGYGCGENPAGRDQAAYAASFEQEVFAAEYGERSADLLFSKLPDYDIAGDWSEAIGDRPAASWQILTRYADVVVRDAPATLEVVFELTQHDTDPAFRSRMFVIDGADFGPDPGFEIIANAAVGLVWASEHKGLSYMLMRAFPESSNYVFRDGFGRVPLNMWSMSLERSDEPPFLRVRCEVATEFADKLEGRFSVEAD
ncbi:MAG: hypothetical protein AAF297_03660 [Planctomycetota bacterium]